MTRETGWYVSLVTGTRRRWALPRCWAPVWGGILSLRQRHSPHCIVQVRFKWKADQPEIWLYVFNSPWIHVERTNEFIVEPDEPSTEVVPYADRSSKRS